MEDDLLVLIEEYGAGAVGGHLRAAQPRPQVLIGLLKIVSLKGQCNEIFDPLLFGFKKLYICGHFNNKQKRLRNMFRWVRGHANFEKYLETKQKVRETVLAFCNRHQRPRSCFKQKKGAENLVTLSLEYRTVAWEPNAN